MARLDAAEKAYGVLGQQVGQRLGLGDALRAAGAQRDDDQPARAAAERQHVRARLDRLVRTELAADREDPADQLLLVVAPLAQQAAAQLPVDGPAVVRIDE